MSGIPLARLTEEALCRHAVSLHDDASYVGCVVTHGGGVPLVLDRSYLVRSSWGSINGRILGYLVDQHGEGLVTA